MSRVGKHWVRVHVKAPKHGGFNTSQIGTQIRTQYLPGTVRYYLYSNACTDFLK